MAGLRVRVLTDSAELAAIAGPWDALVRSAPRPCPFILHAWLEERVRRLEGRVEPAILVAERDGVVVAGLPLGVETRFGVRIARLLAGDTVSHLDVLASDEEAGEAIVAALSTLPADLVVATGIVPASRLAGAPGFRLLQRERAPYLEMPDGWEATYERLLSSRRRREHVRLGRKLAALGDIDVTIVRDSAAVVAGLEETFALHDRRFVAAVDRSDFRTPVDRRVHLAKARRLADAGVVRLGLLRVGGDLAAFGYTFVLGHVGWLFRAAFDDRFAAGQPGLRLMRDTFQELSAEGVTRVEYLGGAYPYKMALSSGEEPLLEASGYAPGATGRAALTARRTAVAARARFKQSPALRRAYAEGRGLLKRRAA